MTWGQLAQLTQDIRSTQHAPGPTRDIEQVMADHIAWTDMGQQHDLALPAVYAAVRLIATTIDQMPLTTEGTMPSWLENPRRVGGQFDQGDLVQFAVVALALHGAAYLQVSRPPGGSGWLLEPLRNEQVQVIRSTSGPVRLTFLVDGMEMPTLPWHPQDRTRQRYLLHVPYLVTPQNPEGISPLQAAARSMRGYQDVETAAAGLLAGGTFVGGRLETDKDITAQTAREVRDGWVQARKTGLIPVLGGGLRYSETRLSMQDAQMLETRGWNAVMVCSVYGIPPAMLGYSMAGGESSLSYSNAQDQRRWLRTNALSGFTRQLEDALSELTNIGQGPVGVTPNRVRFDWTEWEVASGDADAADTLEPA